METRQRHIVHATWVGVIANILLTAAKGLVGFMSNSQALLADAAHSASDIAGSFVVLFGVKISTRPPDEEHPYGHGKAEHIASMIVALLLILIGIQIAFVSIRVLFGAPPTPAGKLALAVTVVSVVMKEALFHYKFRLGKRYNSVALVAEAWHHRSDAFSSVAALMGVGLAIIGDRFGIIHLLYADALAGMVVALIVIKVGYSLAKDSSLVMMEKVLDESEVQKFTATAQAISGVLRIDQLLARSHGRYVVIDIKVGVDRYLSVEAGHAIGKRVKAGLLTAHPEVEDVLVHVNPYGDR